MDEIVKKNMNNTPKQSLTVSQQMILALTIIFVICFVSIVVFVVLGFTIWNNQPVTFSFSQPPNFSSLPAPLIPGLTLTKPKKKFLGLFGALPSCPTNLFDALVFYSPWVVHSFSATNSELSNHRSPSRLSFSFENNESILKLEYKIFEFLNLGIPTNPFNDGIKIKRIFNTVLNRSPVFGLFKQDLDPNGISYRTCLILLTTPSTAPPIFTNDLLLCKAPFTDGITISVLVQEISNNNEVGRDVTYLQNCVRQLPLNHQCV